MSVVYIYLCFRVVESCAQTLFGLCKGVEAEAVALPSDSLYSNNGSYRSIVHGTRVGDDLNTCNLVAQQSFQLIVVVDSPAVDVIDWLATANDLKVFSFLYYSRYLAQHVLCRTCLFECRASDACYHGVAFQTCIWQLSLDDNLLQLVNIEGVKF